MKTPNFFNLILFISYFYLSGFILNYIFHSIFLTKTAYDIKNIFYVCETFNNPIYKMELTHIEHIGIAVKDLKAAILYYEEVLGLKCYAIEEVKDQKVKTAFFKIGKTKLELLESMSSDSAIAKFIEKKGEGLHHIAFAVNKLQTALKEIEDKGVSLIDKKPRKGAEGLNIAFLHPKNTFGVLTEFCSNSKNL